MPEGPEIRRAADRIEQVLAGRRVLRVRFGLEPLKRHEPAFRNVRLLRVDTRGKAMLSRFDNGLSIYSHNQLYGRWMIVPAGTLPETRRQLRLALEGEKHRALLYSASEIAVLTPEQEAVHPFLSRLGPDVLGGLDEQELVARLLSPDFRRRRLGTLLVDQGFVAGLGNYLRCEILYAAGLRPELRPADLGPEHLQRLARAMLELPRRSLRTGGITQDEADARALMDAGAGFEEARFFVFRRAGLPCRVCGNTILLVRDAGQACYLCPGCQQ
ncbi:MAG: endonuclease VIII [Gammaproteobacteria bacterium]|nr:MAG: endonuclease VIII [Gammaproteobacteria bacterium]